MGRKLLVSLVCTVVDAVVVVVWVRWFVLRGPRVRWLSGCGCRWLLLRVARWFAWSLFVAVAVLAVQVAPLWLLRR